MSLTAWLGSISDNQKPNTINEPGCNREWVEEEYERGNHCKRGRMVVEEEWTLAERILLLWAPSILVSLLYEN